MSMPTTADAGNAGRFDLLASALAGRRLRVAYGDPGEPPWTDGTTVVIDPASSDPELLAAVAVQACLIRAGSLQPETLRSMRRRPKLAARYLAVEGHRALHDNAALVPPALRPLIDMQSAARSTSPAASLTIAASRQPIAHPPVVFGAIHANKVLAAQHTSGSDTEAAQQRHTPQGQPSDLNEARFRDPHLRTSECPNSPGRRTPQLALTTDTKDR
jgi:nitric oxide reductase NorD protein